MRKEIGIRVVRKRKEGGKRKLGQMGQESIIEEG